ncbi:hypothetical protein ANCCAN_25140 [Ancylostoma caninum]|uniref:Uncharacterized protein n=1 Tax=Ancylostoma caninum TaxID=29170 RepID=A0A368FDM9_ANCCA|nr:hypothetical protein ANCCAN_25140 [Ancylostoma caninum]
MYIMFMFSEQKDSLRTSGKSLYPTMLLSTSMGSVLRHFMGRLGQVQTVSKLKGVLVRSSVLVHSCWLIRFLHLVV